MRFASAVARTLLCLASAPAPAAAQVALRIATDLYARPGGPLIASLMPGARVTMGATGGLETQVTIEGWVDANRLGARRDSFPASVSGRLTLRLRSQPSMNGTVVASLQPGTGLHVVGRRGTWARVRRTGWMPTASTPQRAAVAPAPVESGGAAIPNAPKPSAPVLPPVAPPAQGPEPRSGNAVVASSGTRFRDLPVGRVIGGIIAGSSVEIVARQSGWVRLRADGWVPEQDVVVGEGSRLPDVSAADLRADPQGMRGRIVQWDVEVMALQIADPLRSGLEREEPYLLARGPGSENAILYLAVPAALLAEVRALPALARIHVTARVRHARSEPAGTPILDIMSIGKR